MIPKEQKGPVMDAMGDLSGPAPFLDLGKKLSVPQDLMMEELSLSNNRGSLLFQKRQRRVQKFTFEFAASRKVNVTGSVQAKVTGTAEPGTAQAANGPQEQNYRSELQVFPASSGSLEHAEPAVSRAESARSPSALAPGYAEPLKGVPPEKFNHTAIPKAYRCPWQEFVSCREYLSDRPSHASHPAAESRDFNKTPVPFGGPLVGEAIPRASTPFAPELSSGLEFLRLRRNFNRVAQGWVRNLPETEEL